MKDRTSGKSPGRTSRKCRPFHTRIGRLPGKLAGSPFSNIFYYFTQQQLSTLDPQSNSNNFKKDVKVILIKRFVFEAEAYLAESKLNSLGIKSFVSNSTMSSMMPFTDGGYLLHVAEKDKVAALEILNQMANAERPDESYHDADIGDIEYEKELTEYEEKLEQSSAKQALLIVVIILIISFIWYGINNIFLMHITLSQ